MTSLLEITSGIGCRIFFSSKNNYNVTMLIPDGHFIGERILSRRPSDV